MKKNRLSIGDFTNRHWQTSGRLVKKNRLSIDDFTNRHWQTSGRLVQELSACTVSVLTYYIHTINVFYSFDHLCHIG